MTIKAQNTKKKESLTIGKKLDKLCDALDPVEKAILVDRLVYTIKDTEKILKQVQAKNQKNKESEWVAVFIDPKTCISMCEKTLNILQGK